jgi:predicted ATPase
VPATLKDSLMARLDRLAEAREVAQIAAVIGRQFSLPLLEAVAPKRGPELESALAKLVATGIVFPEGRGMEQRFSFKHALLRDAAYESLLMARRREWHERTARALEERFSEAAANEPELLAHHFAEAGLAEKACEYRTKAGDRALNRSAYNEAIANFSAALKAAEASPPSQERMRRELNLLLKLGPALGIVHGMQSGPAEEAYRRAAGIGEQIGDGTGLYRAKWGLWLTANLGRKTALARERAGELVKIAQQSGDSDQLLELIIAAGPLLSSAATSRSVAQTPGSARKPMTWRDTAISAQPSAGTIPACARMWFTRTAYSKPATAARPKRLPREHLIWPNGSTIPSALPMHCTISP